MESVVVMGMVIVVLIVIGAGLYAIRRTRRGRNAAAAQWTGALPTPDAAKIPLETDKTGPPAA